MSDFKLCKQAGLHISEHSKYGHFVQGARATDCWIIASDVEAMLANAPVVYGWDHRAGYVFDGQKVDEDLHWQGKIVCRQPIAKDTHESLLREMLDWWFEYGDTKDPRDIINRTKRLLGDEK